MLQVHVLVNWINPYDKSQYHVFIAAVDLEAQTADIIFEDGSMRGSVPLNQIVPFNGEEHTRPRDGKGIRPRGINSDEAMGRF